MFLLVKMVFDRLANMLPGPVGKCLPILIEDEVVRLVRLGLAVFHRDGPVHEGSNLLQARSLPSLHLVGVQNVEPEPGEVGLQNSVVSTFNRENTNIQGGTCTGGSSQDWVRSLPGLSAIDRRMRAARMPRPASSSTTPSTSSRQPTTRLARQHSPVRREYRQPAVQPDP